MNSGRGGARVFNFYTFKKKEFLLKIFLKAISPDKLKIEWKHPLKV